MALRERSRRYAALDYLSDPVWVFDIDRRQVHWANAASMKVWSASSLDELCGRDMGVDMSEAVALRLAQYQSDFIAHGASFNEQWCTYPSGTPVLLNIRFSGHRLPDGRMAMLCEGRVSNVAEPESLRSVEALLHTAAMISLYDANGRPLYRNPAARESARASTDTLADRIVDASERAGLMAALRASGSATRTILVATSRGDCWHELSARHCKDAVTGDAACLVSEVDVSAIKNAETQAQFMALHDPLTGLPNRSHLAQRFAEVAPRLAEDGQQAALMSIDLDNFKDVNDTLGHAAGDLLLVEIARRLRRTVRAEDFVARLGGDEFVILVIARDVSREIERLRQPLVRRIAEPLMIDGHEVRATPSMGVSFFPQDGRDIETLLSRADLAMYTAKERGRNELVLYDRSMSDRVTSRMALEAQLRHAIDRQEFAVFYQPIVDVASGVVVGAEALVRWQHPTRGLVAPDVFIPACERTGMIYELGRFVFRTAAVQHVAWRKAGHDLRVSVNLSPRQLMQAELLSDLTQSLRDAQCDPGRMQVEITESMLVGKDETPLRLLHAIKAIGIGIALDDFGTGYSNLAYLQRYPISTLKIDKSFVQCVEANRALAEMIVAMCRLMKLKVVAEGVETPEQLSWVRAHDIELFQGYLFSKPLAVRDMNELLERVRAQPQTATGADRLEQLVLRL
jgi:diguanylate cyclase (GGDEF)-like protein